MGNTAGIRGASPQVAYRRDFSSRRFGLEAGGDAGRPGQSREAMSGLPPLRMGRSFSVFDVSSFSQFPKEEKRSEEKNTSRAAGGGLPGAREEQGKAVQNRA